MQTKIIINERISELMFDKQLDNVALAKQIGVNEASVRKWKSGGLMSLSTAIKIANYFNCSLDFLIGRSDNVLDFAPKECPPFYNYFKNKINDIGITTYKISKNTRVKSSHLFDWKRGSDPNISLIIEIADYLGITLDELVGRDR